MLVDYSIKIAAIGIVPENRRPSSSNAWLLLILLVPIVGLPLFLLMGSPYINRRRHRIQQEGNAMIDNVHTDIPDLPATSQLDPDVESMIRLSRSLTGYPAMYSHNKGFYADYDAGIHRLAEVIDTAKEYVHVEIYIQAWDETTDVFYRSLERAVARGVEVRLLIDHIGSWKYPKSSQLGKKFDAIGVKWRYMLPLKPLKGRFRRPDLRNHRKIIVIDGEVGFIGSINMIDRGYLMRNHRKAGRQWIDVLAEFTGPVVASMESVFAVDWYSESGETLAIATPHDNETETTDDLNLVQFLPSGPGYTTEPNLRMFNAVIHHAREHLVICSPYFIPDESLLEAVTSACYRGVRVDLLVSEKADQFLVHHAQSSYYQALLEAGVRIHQFPEPFILHTKFVLADHGHPHSVAVFGSSNLDMRSFGLNYESSVFVAEGDLLDQLERLGRTYMDVSIELTLKQWNQRSRGRRYVDNVCRLTSALQ